MLSQVWFEKAWKLTLGWQQLTNDKFKALSSNHGIFFGVRLHNCGGANIQHANSVSLYVLLDRFLRCTSPFGGIICIAPDIDVCHFKDMVFIHELDCSHWSYRWQACCYIVLTITLNTLHKESPNQIKSHDTTRK